MHSYINNNLYFLSYRTNRAAWRWARDRGSIASRWSWLLAQISDLEYRIRQHNELYNQIKKNKGVVTFDDVNTATATGTPTTTDDDIPKQPSNQSVNGYRGVLPGSSAKLSSGGDTESAGPNGAYDPNASLGASRTRPFHRAGFRKRKLMQTANLHTISKKAAKSR
jgi:KAT8 regulatory NSL complex subunit 1